MEAHQEGEAEALEKATTNRMRGMRQEAEVLWQRCGIGASGQEVAAY